MSLQTIHPKF